MLKTIKEQFKRVVSYSQDIPDPQIDELFDDWLRAKQDIIEIFDGKLIYEFPETMTFHLDPREKERKIDNFIDYVYDMNNPSLGQFLELNRDGFFDNQVSHPYVNDNKVIPKGMKLVKSFKYFDTNKRRLEDIQNIASQIIQEDKVTGKLCFSVHPLDFLSVSENTYNWHSCHALDGEYRAGNLSYMVDKATVICYIKGADGVKLPMFPEDVPWNSKKWRVLFYLSDNWNMVFAGRQYPFSTQPGLYIARERLLTLMRKDPAAYCDWTDPIITSVKNSYDLDYDVLDPHILIRGRIYLLNEIVMDEPGSLQFNDVLRSSCYRPHYTAFRNVPWHPEMRDRVHVGGACKCLRCGQTQIEDPETFMCDDCEFEFGTSSNDTYAYCECCGRRMLVEESSDVDGQEICENCVRNECFVCDSCDEIHFNVSKVYLTDKDMCVCDGCYAEYFYDEYNEKESEEED